MIKHFYTEYSHRRLPRICDNLAIKEIPSGPPFRMLMYFCPDFCSSHSVAVAVFYFTLCHIIANNLLKLPARVRRLAITKGAGCVLVLAQPPKSAFSRSFEPTPRFRPSTHLVASNLHSSRRNMKSLSWLICFMAF